MIIRLFATIGLMQTAAIIAFMIWAVFLVPFDQQQIQPAPCQTVFVCNLERLIK